MISFENLQKKFGNRVLFDSLNFSVRAGEFVALFGPNGCGKTTLMNILCSIEPASEGRIRGGDALRDRIGYVFQDYRRTLLPWLTGYENIEFPLKLRGVNKRERKRRIEELIETVGATLNLHQRVFHLSGGQAQKIALLRALVIRPELLILDEPFSALDFESTLSLRETIGAITDKLKLTTLLISHDLEEALYLADRVIFLSAAPTVVTEELNLSWPRPRQPQLLGSPSFAEKKLQALSIVMGEQLIPRRLAQI